MPASHAGKTIPAPSPVILEDVVRGVLDMIFVRPWTDDSLWHEYGMLGRRAWLVDALTVSRVWYNAGIPVLYRTIELNPKDERTIDLLLRALKRQPDLARLIHALRPYERNYEVPRRRPTTSEIRSILPVPSIPFLTAKGRARQAAARRSRKIRALMVMCTNGDELVMDADNLSVMAPALAAMSNHLQSIALHNAERLDVALFSRAADWSTLRNLRLEASSDSWVRRGGHHGRIPSFDVGAFVPMTRLVSLELLGWVEPELMREILRVLRGSLRSLACNQLFSGMKSAGWLAPVRSSLTTLVLYVGYGTPLDDLSSLTAVKLLKLVLIAERYPRFGEEQRTGTIFPPATEEIEWEVWSATLQQQLTAKRVGIALEAFDRGCLPELRALRLRIDVGYPPDVQPWKPTVSSLSGACRTRGLVFSHEFETDFNCVGPQDTRDVFGSGAWARHQERERVLKWKEMQRHMDLGLWERAKNHTVEVGHFIRDLVYCMTSALALIFRLCGLGLVRRWLILASRWLAMLWKDFAREVHRDRQAGVAPVRTRKRPAPHR